MCIPDGGGIIEGKDELVVQSDSSPVPNSSKIPCQSPCVVFSIPPEGTSTQYNSYSKLPKSFIPFYTN